MKTYDHFSQLVEARSVPTLYHATRSWKKILLDGELMAFGITGEELRHVPEAIRRRHGNNYISFARSMGSSYVNHIINGDYSNGAVLEFDTKGLRNKYKIIPVDYFKDKNAFGKSVTLKVSGQFEMEERLITSKDTVPLKPYLVAVHMVDPLKVIMMNIQSQERGISSLSAVISKGEKELGRAKEDGDEARIRTAEYNLDFAKRQLKGYEDVEADYHERADAINNWLRKLMNKHSSVPFYFYDTYKEMKTGRFSLARQANPHLPDHDDIDEDDD